VQVTERCNLQCLPAELLVKVMRGMDFPNLRKLIEAWPAAAGFVRTFEEEILCGVLSLAGSPQIVMLILAVMIVRTHHIDLLSNDRIAAFIALLDNETPALCPFKRVGEDSVTMLLDIGSIYESIELLVETVASTRIILPSKNPHYPPWPTELCRIRRASGRFQLCYEMCNPEGYVSPSDRFRGPPISLGDFVYHPTDDFSLSMIGRERCPEEGWLFPSMSLPRRRPCALTALLKTLCTWGIDELQL